MNRNDPYHDYDWDNDGYPGHFVYGDDKYVDESCADEIWKPVAGFGRNYWISNLGRVWSARSKSFLKLKSMDNHGHLGVCLYNNGERHYRYIHRLVAEAFIPNPHNYPIVRHICDNPRYNACDDLLWGTQKDNIADSISNGKAYSLTPEDREKGYAERKTPIIATHITNGSTLYFDSQAEASRILGIPQANIWKVLTKQRSRAGDYIFIYDERSE